MFNDEIYLTQVTYVIRSYYRLTNTHIKSQNYKGVSIVHRHNVHRNYNVFSGNYLCCNSMITCTVVIPTNVLVIKEIS